MSIPIQEFRTVPIRDDLRQKRENGDVILDADGKKFAAHSVILASQSAILANHIEKQFEAQRKAKSKSNGRIELKTKLAAQTMRILLQLLYHEQVSAPLETIFDVLLAADKYRILHIVDCTAATLSENITLPVAVSVMNVYHGTQDPSLTDLVCTSLDCISMPSNFYELTDESKPGNPLNRHIQLLSYDAIKMIVERQVMAENKAEFVHASCKLVNIWASPIPSEERLLFITELLKVMDIQSLNAMQMANVIRLEAFMDNHQTQGYLMKTITKLLVQLEVTKLHHDFKYVNADVYKENIAKARVPSSRAQSVHNQHWDYQPKKMSETARSMPGLADDYTMAPHPASRSHRSQSRNHSRSHHSTRHVSPDRESMMSHNTIRTVDSRRSHASKKSTSRRSKSRHHSPEAASGGSYKTLPSELSRAMSQTHSSKV